MLCPICAFEAERSRYRRAINKVIGLRFITKIGDVAMWVCPKCHSFFCKRYKSVEKIGPPILANAYYRKKY